MGPEQHVLTGDETIPDPGLDNIPLVVGERKAESKIDHGINESEATSFVNEINKTTPDESSSDNRHKRKPNSKFRKLTKLAHLMDAKGKGERGGETRMGNDKWRKSSLAVGHQQSDNRTTDDSYQSQRGTTDGQEMSPEHNRRQGNKSSSDESGEDGRVQTTLDHVTNAMSKVNDDANSEHQTGSDSEPHSENDDSDPTPEHRRRSSFLMVDSTQEPPEVRKDHDTSFPTSNGYKVESTTRAENKKESQNDIYKDKIETKKKKKLAGAVMTPLSIAMREPRKRIELSLPVPEIKVTDYSDDSSDSEPIPGRKHRVAATVHVTPQDNDTISLDSVIIDIADDNDNGTTNRSAKYIYKDKPMYDKVADNADNHTRFQRALALFQNNDK